MADSLDRCEDILLLSTADWDNPFWTNKQHVACELSRRGHKVFYVDSIGLRQPGVNKSDLGRIFKRLIKGIRPPRKVRDNLWVWSPLIIPLQKYALVRMINRAIMKLMLNVYPCLFGFKKPIVWTYNPITTEVYGLKKPSLLVYHCVDEIKAQPGMPVDSIEKAEKELVKLADFVFVTSKKLLESRKELNPSVYLFTNVADFDHFSRARQSSTQVPADIEELPKPVIGFIGAISAYKMDFKLLLKLSGYFKHCTIVLIGKVGEGEPETDVSILRQCDNIVFLGARSYQDLPAYIKAFDVAIIPSALNEYTHAMFPMKFFEYMAAGVPVVTTAIDSLKEFEDYAVIAENHQAFIVGVETALNDRNKELDRRLELARSKTYSRRTQSMMELIHGESS